MEELTRILNVQITVIGDKELFNSKKAAVKEVKSMFDDCDDVQVTVQDFIIDKE